MYFQQLSQKLRHFGLFWLQKQPADFRELLALLLEDSVTPEILVYRDCRRTEKLLAGLLHIADYAGLGPDLGVVRNIEMTGNTYLASENTVLSDLCRTRDTALCGHNGVVPYHDIMRNLAKIVDFHSVADDGRFHFRPVNGSACADFDIVSDDDIADMLDLLPSSVRLRGVSETVRTDYGIGMDNHIVTDNHTRINAHSRIDDAMRTDLGIVTYIYILINLCIVTDYSMMTYIGMASEINLLSEFGGQEP